MRSQARQHVGKRGAAQRKARREGYHDMGDFVGMLNLLNDGKQVSLMDPDALIADMPHSNMRMGGSERRCPHIRAAFRHGAHDWARKHGGGA